MDSYPDQKMAAMGIQDSPSGGRVSKKRNVASDIGWPTFEGKDRNIARQVILSIIIFSLQPL